MARLSLSLLGPFQATLDGEPLTGFASAKVRALLAYLAVESGRPHWRESLAGLLWPGYSERSAHTNLSNALSSLRSILQDRQILTPRHREHKAGTQDSDGSESRSRGFHTAHGVSGDRDQTDTKAGADTRVRPYILVDRETVQFDRQSDAWVDVWEFENQLRVVSFELGTPELKTRGDASRPHSKLETGVALYRGPFMDGFTLRDSPPYEQWVLVTRERLQRQVMEALARLTALQEEGSEYEQALDTARRQLEIEPWQEGAHQAAMRLLAHLGRRSDALAQYEACVHILKQELAVEPAVETTRLWERIREGDRLGLDVEGAPTLTWVVAEERPRHNLPAQVTSFVGRERELDELGRLLADPGVRLVTVVGPGGCGKTRLALEVAAAQVERYEHGVWFASLAAVPSAEGVVSAVAKAMDFQFRPGGDPRQQLLDYLREKRMLLVLDNWEHLAGQGASTDLLSEMLATAPQVQVLATSRARLNLQGEHAFHLEGMEYPHPSPGGRGAGGEGAMQYSAVQLFVQAAQRVDPKGGGEYAADEMDAVVRICRLVEGMPLALVLAAAWAEMLTPAEIGDEIERSLDFLAAEWRDLPERQRSVRAVFDGSWRLLSEREQAVLAALSVFRGGFTREAAERVAGADLRILASLVGKSLIALAEANSVDRAGLGDGRGLQRGESTRYDLHQLLRQYAEEKLNSTPDGGRAVRDRHSAHYAARCGQWEADLKGARRAEALADMRLEIDNLRAAWAWAVEQGQVERLGQMTDSLGQFCIEQGLRREGESVFRAAAERVEAAAARSSPAAPDHLRILARLLAWHGYFAFCLGHCDDADRSLAQGRSLLERPELAGHDVRIERALLLTFAGLRMADLDIQAARQRWEQSLVLWREMGNNYSVGMNLGNLAIAALLLSDYRTARRYWEEQAELVQSTGWSNQQWDVSWGLGEVAAVQGDTATAVRLATALYGPYQAGDGRPTDDSACWMWGGVLLYLGEYEEAEALWARSVAIWTEHTPGLAYRPLMELIDTRLHLGRYQEAHALAERVLAMTRAQHLQDWTARALGAMGSAAIAVKYPQARQTLEESIALFRQGKMFRDTLGVTLADMAYLGRALGQPEQAWACLREALQIGQETGALDPLVHALPVAALLLADRGEDERAAELYALAWRHPRASRSRWFQDLYGESTAAVAEGLPPEAFAAAQARGRARDLQATVAELLEELETNGPLTDDR